MFERKKSAAREYKSVKFELDSTDEKTGEFAGYAAVFGNLDGGRDIIQPGAFVKTIAEDFDRIKILSQHNDCELPIGKPLELREDEKGLYIRGKVSDTQMGRDVKTLLKDGVLNELSIGYDAVDFDYDGKNNIRYLKAVKLWEVSIATWAMNDQATIDEVKSLAEELRAEAKSGRMNRTKLNTLRQFIAVVRELVNILGPFLEPSEPEVSAPETPGKPMDAGKKKPKLKPAGTIIEIVPAPDRR